MKKHHVHIGHTGITWRNSAMEQAITDVSGLGFYGFETFGNVFRCLGTEAWRPGRRSRGASPAPGISAYCNFNLTDPAKRQENLDNAIRWTGIVKKYGGRFIVIGPNPVHRPIPMISPDQG